MEIKGIKEGILISFQGQEWQVVKESLIQIIAEKGAFSRCPACSGCHLLVLEPMPWRSYKH